MIPKEILDKVKKIEITTRNLVDEIFSGEYHSIFKGQGLEFSEVRPYQPGDNVKFIDWNVTARTGTPYIKKFEETRELTVLLMIDVSRSGAFGSINKFKREIAAEIGSVLAFSAIKNNDKVGLLLFSDAIEKYIPPKKGKKAVLRLIREILYHKAQNHKTNIQKALEYYYKMSKKRSIIFLISDFFDKDYMDSMQIVAQKHDLIAVRILDPHELELPGKGYFNLEDAETGKTQLINAADKTFRENFQKRINQRINSLQKDLKKNRIDLIDIRTDETYVKSLIKFFTRRIRRRR
ncbi:MAG: DUF58 domain-containing protein [Candidatus Cloacimonetes bacterium]|nr:DUF58 domain-containing protein [Candidatus Cloacimonadota bacterium]MBS3766607.1 DUF58 domain-containing protein [Candidatus Cloacimonadota bacterium]